MKPADPVTSTLDEAATLALRLHYAVDLVAGSVLGFLVIFRFYRYAKC
jgi:membrane-associated phospholipid phosphatase